MNRQVCGLERIVSHPSSQSLEFIYGFYYAAQQGARGKGEEEMLPFSATEKVRVVTSGFKCSGRHMGMNGIEKFVSSKRFMEKAISA